MNDLKYDIVGGRLWHREGQYFIPDDEPVVVLRGKDPVALRMIEMYLASGPDASNASSMAVNAILFREYQRKYPA